jgi:aspartyl-tRNA(Asn)/glutamyl-tRNA(Gln) amidotransferase subunit C
MLASPPMPAPKLDRALVLHVAKLSSLSLSEAEADKFAGELARIVTYVEQLDGVDTADVAATAHVQLDRMPLREDALTPCLSHDDALAQAPQVEGGGFAVPTFVE